MKLTHNLNDRVVAFDCDDTLVMWEDNVWEPAPHRIPFACPITLMGDGQIIKTETVHLVPHEKHIQKLKGYARSGYYVIVWSAGGGAWAKTVVETLGLQDVVNLTTCKPVYLYDDLPLNEALGERKYFSDKKKE